MTRLRWRTFPWRPLAINLPSGYTAYLNREENVIDLVYGADEFVQWVPAAASIREIHLIIDEHMAKRHLRGDELHALVGEVWAS